jgi:NAD(P)H-nitrite reductase large subunit
VSEPLVIVGNGMTAAQLVDELTRYALARHAIGVIGDEQCRSRWLRQRSATGIRR